MKYRITLLLFAQVWFADSLHAMKVPEFVIWEQELKKNEASLGVVIDSFPSSILTLDSDFLLTAYTTVLLLNIASPPVYKEGFTARLEYRFSSYQRKQLKEFCKEVAQARGKTFHDVCKEIKNFNLKVIRFIPRNKSFTLKKIILPDDIHRKMPMLEKIEIFHMSNELFELNIEVNGKSVRCGELEGHLIWERYWLGEYGIERGVIPIKKAIEKLISKQNEYGDRLLAMPDSFKKTKVIISSKEFSLIPEMASVRAPKIFALIS